MGKNWEHLLLRQELGFEANVLLFNLISECHRLKIMLVIDFAFFL